MVARTGAGGDNDDGGVWLAGAHRREGGDRVRESPQLSPQLSG